MTSTPRERCYAALAAYDEVANEQTYVGAPRNTVRQDRAIRELAAALDALYGPVPAETEYERQGRLRAVDTRSQDL